MDQLEKNKTLRYILTTLLAIGNFLNGTNVSLSQEDIYGVGFSFSLCRQRNSSTSSFVPLWLLCQHICLAWKTVDALCRRMCCELPDCLTAPDTVLLKSSQLCVWVWEKEAYILWFQCELACVILSKPFAYERQICKRETQVINIKTTCSHTTLTSTDCIVFAVRNQRNPVSISSLMAF